VADRQLLNLTRLGWGLAIPVLFLLGIGLACIHATDRDLPALGLAPPGDPGAPQLDTLTQFYYWVGPNTTKQIAFALSGIGLLLAVLWPSYQRIGRYSYLIYAVAVFMLLLLVLDRYVNIPFVPVVRNTRRWIDVGVRVQPSEFMKIALVLTLARYLRFRDTYRSWSGLIAPFVLTVIPMGLILKQPDLGTLLMLLPVLFALLFVAGARRRHLATIIIAGCALLPPFYVYGMQGYQKTRIDVLFKQGSHDESWHMDEGYQLRQSKVALGTGGVWGTGYGKGVFVQYDGLLPEEHNDFIFAIIGHQWGLVGCIAVILAYSLIVLFGLEVATITNDPYGKLLAIGVIVMIVAQALLNICMTIGLAPITGMPLPFVSAGGSSLWANFIALGLLVNVAQRRPLLIAQSPFQHEE
jgi:rod shape determining protein RodA